jgi:glutamyl-tRNA synthetase
MNSDPTLVATHLNWHLKNLGIDSTTGADLIEIVKAQRERCKTLVEMAEASRYFYQDFEQYDPKAAKKNFKAGSDKVLQHLADAFSSVENWDGKILHQIVLDTAETLELKLGKVAQPLRVAVCGCAVSPAIDITLSLLGRDKVLNRIQTAINYIEGLDK